MECKKPNFVGYTDGEFQVSCTGCEDGFSVVSITPVASQVNCRSLDVIQHCAQYSKSGSFVHCDVCSDGYYLNDTEKRCYARTSIDNCSVYEPEADECKTCLTGFVLQDSNTVCKINP